MKTHKTLKTLLLKIKKNLSFYDGFFADMYQFLTR